MIVFDSEEAGGSVYAMVTLKGIEEWGSEGTNLFFLLLDFKGYVRNREFKCERFLLLVDLPIIQKQFEIALVIVMKHTIQLHSTMTFIIEVVFIVGETSHNNIAVSCRRLSTVNHHRFDQRSSHVQLFYPSFKNPILTIMIILLLQILRDQSHDSSHSGRGHRSALHLHHTAMVIAVQSAIPSAQRLGWELIAWRHNIGLDGAFVWISARREIRDVVLSVMISLGMRRSDSNHVLGKGGRRSESAWLSFVYSINQYPSSPSLPAANRMSMSL